MKIGVLNVQRCKTLEISTHPRIENPLKRENMSFDKKEHVFIKKNYFLKKYIPININKTVTAHVIYFL